MPFYTGFESRHSLESGSRGANSLSDAGSRTPRYCSLLFAGAPPRPRLRELIACSAMVLTIGQHGEGRRVQPASVTEVPLLGIGSINARILT
jgi:hypothetical protein